MVENIKDSNYFIKMSSTSLNINSFKGINLCPLDNTNEKLNVHNRIKEGNKEDTNKRKIFFI